MSHDDGVMWFGAMFGQVALHVTRHGFQLIKELCSRTILWNVVVVVVFPFRASEQRECFFRLIGSALNRFTVTKPFCAGKIEEQCILA